MNRLIALLPLMVLALSNVQSQQIIINELYNSGATNDEWTELLVVQDSLDLRSWDLRDFSSGGVPQNPLAFSSNALWAGVRAGTIIVVARPENLFAEDTDPSDYLLIVKTNNALYFAGNPFNFAGPSDAIQIRNSSDTHVFGVSWGGNNAASLPSPKAHFGGTVTSGNTIYFNEDSLPELTSPASWAFNTPAQSLGTGNTPTNQAWIDVLRGAGSPDGSGTASITPDTLDGGTSADVTIVYGRDTSVTITNMRVIVPDAFTWAQLLDSITYTNMTATASVNGDTISFDSLAFSADSTIITIRTVTAPDSTGVYSWKVQTRGAVQFRDVSPLPRIVVFGTPVPIADVKVNDANGIPLRVGQLVTIQGVVTVANEFGSPSFLQDNSAGIAIFGSSFSGVVSVGDEVVVSGVVSPFNGLSELTNPILHAVVSTGNTVSPLVVTSSDVFNDGAGGVEEFEGLLVRINVVGVIDTTTGLPPPTWSACGSLSGCNYRLLDATGHVDIRADNNVDFFGAAAPQGIFDVVGVVSQFKPSLPFIGGYQLQPRSSQDILSTGPIIASSPVESNIQQTSFSVGWTTVNPGTSRLRYGITLSYELGIANDGDTAMSTAHNVNLAGLDPATIYNVQAFSFSGADTSFAANIVVSTSSPSGSTGQINVYFNKSIDSSVSSGETALGNQDLIGLLVQRINNARRSIDLSLYSLSANNQGDVIAGALVAAKNRGVKVRAICEADNQNSPGSSFHILSDGGITVINDRFDPVWNGQGLMHNKFLVFDYRGGANDSIRVWTGSWNPSFQGTTQDRQNAIELQDVALAGAYTREFNEMWGSDTDTPNAANARFGGRKRDNTPHKFVINGVPLTSSFSPSDRTTSRIRSTLANAQSSVSVALLTFTRRDLADTLISRRTLGRRVRVVLDNNTDTGNQYSYLLSNGVDIHLRGGTGLLHHKYAIVDGDRPTGTQYVITGSHNWSNSAENSNDENIVIIENNRLGNLYLQEFAARYYEAGGVDTIVLGTREEDHVPSGFLLDQNFPNPFNPSTVISYTVAVTGRVSLAVFNLLGQEVANLVSEVQSAGRHQVEFPAGHLATGVYFYRLRAGRFVDVKKMLLVR